MYAVREVCGGVCCAVKEEIKAVLSRKWLVRLKKESKNGEV